MKRLLAIVSAITLLLILLLPVSLALAQPADAVHVAIAGQATGFLPAPFNGMVGVTVAAHARGSSTSLEGSGTNHATTGSTNQFSLSGSTTGDVVLLSGTVTRSTAAYLNGSSVQIEANAQTGALTFTLVPLGGPFAGQTLVFTGSGTVVVTGE